MAMRNLILIIAVCILTCASSVVPAVQADAATSQSGSSISSAPRPGDFGLGLMLGSIISITGKYWLNKQGALDFGFGFVGQPWTMLYADYLWHIPRAFGTGTKFGRESSLYFGGGGGLGFWNSANGCGHWNCSWDSEHANSGIGLFVRGLVGAEWYPAPSRFGLFGELGPSIMLIPGTWGALDFDIGGRYYF